MEQCLPSAEALFEEETGQAFVAGIKVMVKVAVEFHELYGYSLTVQDIDPTYTLGIWRVAVAKS